MDAMPPPPPLVYDSSTGTLRSVARYSEPMTLLWMLVIALALFGFADHTMWIVAGALAVVVGAVEYLLYRRRAVRATAAGPRRA